MSGRGFDAFLRWFNRNVKATPLTQATDEHAARMLERFFRVYGIPPKDRILIREQVKNYRKAVS